MHQIANRSSEFIVLDAIRAVAPAAGDRLDGAFQDDFCFDLDVTAEREMLKLLATY